MKILVLGTSGQISIALRKRLDHLGLSYITASRSILETSSTHTKHFKINYFNQSDLTQVFLSEKPHFVINFVTSGSNRDSSDEDKYIYDINFVFPLWIAKLCKSYSTTYVDCGSLAEYEGAAVTPYQEEMILSPTSAYACSKLRAFNCLKDILHGSRTKYIHLRIASVFGPGELSSRLIPKCIHAALTGSLLNVSSLDIVRNYIFIGDLIDWILTFLPSRQNCDFEGCINLASDKSYSIREVISTVETVTSNRILAVDNSYPMSRMDMHPIIPCCLKRRRLGLKEGKLFSDRIRETVFWQHLNPMYVRN